MSNQTEPKAPLNKPVPNYSQFILDLDLTDNEYCDTDNLRDQGLEIPEQSVSD